MQSTSAYSAALDIFVAPSRALNGVNNNKYWTFLPFILLLGLPVAFFAFYFLGHDFSIIKEQLIAAMGDKSPAEIKRASAFFTPHYLTLMMSLQIVIFYLVCFALHGLYLLLATKVDSENTHSYGDWFALAVWARLPELIGTVLSLLMVLFASALPSLNDLNMLSLAGLLSLTPSDKWYSFASFLTLFTFWAIFLSALGISLWTKIDKTRAWVIAALPYVVFYGVWAIIELIKG
ncbi:YIP1 family protein [Gallaecimonas mangrovi]|uniref:YIP1 family protein n=1 Tax=Gallaecimonas mangrovi TaxID=2291597 RepID=UPI000E20A388|nr:YIP1 family protein [Gallaecimonas mangrovi]